MYVCADKIRYSFHTTSQKEPYINENSEKV